MQGRGRAGGRVVGGVLSRGGAAGDAGGAVHRRGGGAGAAVRASAVVPGDEPVGCIFCGYIGKGEGYRGRVVPGDEPVGAAPGREKTRTRVSILHPSARRRAPAGPRAPAGGPGLGAAACRSGGMEGRRLEAAAATPASRRRVEPQGRDRLERPVLRRVSLRAWGQQGPARSETPASDTADTGVSRAPSFARPSRLPCPASGCGPSVGANTSVCGGARP